MAQQRYTRPWPVRSYGWPITLGTVMIVLVIALIVGWVVLSVPLISHQQSRSGLYWLLLFLGMGFLVAVLVGVVLYLWLSIKTIALNQRQSNFIDSVTHELKSPIASLKLYLQTLRRREVSDEQRDDFYRFMLEDIERLDRLINQMLVVARIEQGPMLADTEDVLLAPLIAECARHVAKQYQQPEDCIELELEPAIVRGHRVDLEMIFRNLLDNAVKYSEGTPEVHVRLFVLNSSRVVVRVSDHGRGIPQQWRRKIFGRFVRLGSELERDRPGTGLGLYLVWMAVRNMRGKVQVHSGEQGQGSVFEVSLPGRPVVALESDLAGATVVEEPQG